jgi:hypothetical protein
VKSAPKGKEAKTVFTIGWVAVLLGVLAMLWADGAFSGLRAR